MNRRARNAWQWAIAGTLAGTACTFSPLTNRISVGEEDIVVFVGEGVTGSTDLFASSASGGTPTQLTYTVAIEHLPRLTPDGGMLAFVRARDTSSRAAQSIVVMNLLNAGERSVELPARAGRVTGLGWEGDRTALHVRTTRGRWRVTAPPTDMVASVASGDAQSDSALGVWLGRQHFARAFTCDSGVCVVGRSGDTARIAPRGRNPLRWGTDSVAWFEGSDLIVRGLGPGPARRVTWRRAPSNPRDATYAAGSGVRRDSM